jgi:hypothetical protein
MMKDPIVEQVRRARQALFAKYNYDIEAMLNDARNRQSASGHKIVSFASAARKKNQPK